MGDATGRGEMVTVVMHVDVLPHASAAVQVIVEMPVLNTPLASFPVPFLIVAPVIWNVIVIVPVQLSDTPVNVGIVYVLPDTSQNV